MITFNNQGWYANLVTRLERILQATSLKQCHVAMGAAEGFSLAGYPQKYSNEELTRYLVLVESLTKQREVELVIKGWF